MEPDSISNLIDKLPDLISYIAYGAVFLGLFKFVALRDNNLEPKSKLIACITASFILKELCGFVAGQFGINTESVGYFVITLLITVVISVLSALFFVSDTFNSITSKIGLSRTVNNNFWYDVMKNDTWVFAKESGSDIVYFGIAMLTEEGVKAPKMLLRQYAIGDMQKHQILTNRVEDDASIVIDTAKMDAIEIVYYKDDVPIWDWFKEKIGIEPDERGN